VQEVKDYLDIREINGYSVRYTTFHAAHPCSKEIRCLVYIGMPDNPQFMGALHPQDVAERINRSVGPSGENWEYLLRLEESLKDLGTESSDAHISDLVRRISRMEPRRVGLNRGDKNREDKNLCLHKVPSTGKQEEIEKGDGEAYSTDHRRRSSVDKCLA
jgi:glutathione-specific gamma-glutamylcyclotransferase